MKKNTELENLKIQEKQKVKKEQVDKKWIATILLISFTISFCMSFISQKTIPNINLVFGILITLFIIFIGIIFDLIGVSVTASDEKIFHSMNSRKVKGANIAVKLKKNAEKVSSFCCDVIGDICGVISGACVVTISLSLSNALNTNILLTNLIVAAFVASLTIGGKAVGKSFAINKSDIILYQFSRFISIFYKG